MESSILYFFEDRELLKHMQVIVYHLLHARPEFNGMPHAYIELSAVLKVDRYGGHLVIGDLYFLHDFSGDRAVGPPAGDECTSRHFVPVLRNIERESTCNHAAWQEESLRSP